MSTIQFTVEGMSCGGCSSKVKNTLEAFDQISQVEVELATGEVKVQVEPYQNNDKEQIKSAIEYLGFFFLI